MCVSERWKKKRQPKTKKKLNKKSSSSHPGRRQPLAPRAPRREEVDDDDRVRPHQRLEVRGVDRRGVVDLRGVVRARRVVGNPFSRASPRVAPVVMRVKPCPLAVVAERQLADRLGQVEPLGAERVRDVERRKLARQRRERDVKVDSEELARRGAVDDELLLVGRGEEAVELLLVMSWGGQKACERERREFSSVWGLKQAGGCA